MDRESILTQRIATLKETIRILKAISATKDERINCKNRQIALMELQLSGKPYRVACINGQVTQRR